MDTLIAGVPSALARRAGLCRIAASVTRLVAPLMLASLTGVAAAQTESSPNEAACPPDRQAEAIAGGHDVQPTVHELAEMGCADLTPSESEETDELYQELMQESAPEPAAPTESE